MSSTPWYQEGKAIGWEGLAPGTQGHVPGPREAGAHSQAHAGPPGMPPGPEAHRSEQDHNLGAWIRGGSSQYWGPADLTHSEGEARDGLSPVEVAPLGHRAICKSAGQL